MSVNNSSIKVSSKERDTIYKNSPATLPLNPTNKGFSGQEIRRRLSQSIVGESGSVLKLLEEKFQHVYNSFGSVDGEITRVDNKINPFISEQNQQRVEINQLHNNKVSNDGSIPMTSDWPFGGYKILDVGKVNETTFDKGEDTDAISYVNVNKLFNLKEDNLDISEKGEHETWKEAYGEQVQKKFNQYLKTKDETKKMKDLKDVEFGFILNHHTIFYDNNLGKFINRSISLNDLPLAVQNTVVETSDIKKDYMKKEDYLDSNEKIKLENLPDITKQPTIVFASTSDFNSFDTSGILEGTKAWDNEAKKGYVWKDGNTQKWLVTTNAEWENINLDWLNIKNAPKSKNNNSLKDKNIYSSEEAEETFVKQNEHDSHVENEENPHKVTKAQVGLSEVDNTKDIDKPISNDTQEALNEKADDNEFKGHKNNNENPHNVNAEQVNAYDKEISDSRFIHQTDKGTVLPLLGEDGMILSQYIGPQYNDIRIGYFEYEDPNVLPEHLKPIAFYKDAERTEYVEPIPKVIYISRDHNVTYRYSSTEQEFVGLAPSPISLGETEGTAYPGHLGALNRQDIANMKLQDLQDTTFTNLQAGQALYFDGVVWKNHYLTKTNVGLENVNNWGIATEEEAKQGLLNDKYMTPNRVKQAIDELAPNAPLKIENHRNEEYPHRFTYKGVEYEWGLAMEEGEIGIKYREVIESE